MGGTWADNAFTYRVPIAIPVFVTGGGGATTVDVQVEIPPDWYAF